MGERPQTRVGWLWSGVAPLMPCGALWYVNYCKPLTCTSMTRSMHWTTSLGQAAKSRGSKAPLAASWCTRPSAAAATGCAAVAGSRVFLLTRTRGASRKMSSWGASDRVASRDFPRPASSATRTPAFRRAIGSLLLKKFVNLSPEGLLLPIDLAFANEVIPPDSFDTPDPHSR